MIIFVVGQHSPPTSIYLETMALPLIRLVHLPHLSVTIHMMLSELQQERALRPLNIEFQTHVCSVFVRAVEFVGSEGLILFDTSRAVHSFDLSRSNLIDIDDPHSSIATRSDMPLEDKLPDQC